MCVTQLILLVTLRLVNLISGKEQNHTHIKHMNINTKKLSKKCEQIIDTKLRKLQLYPINTRTYTQRNTQTHTHRHHT